MKQADSNPQHEKRFYYTDQFSAVYLINVIQGDTKKRELLKNPTKIEEIQEKKIIDRN